MDGTDVLPWKDAIYDLGLDYKPSIHVGQYTPVDLFQTKMSLTLSFSGMY